MKKLFILFLMTLLLGGCKEKNQEPAQETLHQYTMYVGTNDKDTYQCEIGIDAAKELVYGIMMDHFSDGFTMYEADGVWRDEDGVVTHETTFVCIVVQPNSIEVYKAADALIVALNQSTILITSSTNTQIDFYTGK